MKKYILVYNPFSGDAYFKFKLDAVIEQFQKRNCLLIPLRSMDKQDIPAFLALARDIGADGIIISGGDGTIHEVINTMLKTGSDLPLGIIPSGTSNDFANYLGLDNDIERSAEIIVRGLTKTVDIGKANDTYFINVASAGLLTLVAHETDTALKNTLGKVAYYLRGIEELPNFRALNMRINADGYLIEDEIFLFLVANSRTVGSFRHVAPDAQVDDGKLDLLVVNKCTIRDLMRLFIGLLNGSHIRQKNIRYIQASNITIECTEELVSDLDGEVGPKLPLTIEAVSRKLRIYCDA